LFLPPKTSTATSLLKTKLISKPPNNRFPVRREVCSSYCRTSPRGDQGSDIDLFQAASVKVKRHKRIKAQANPYDPEDELYFERRVGRKICRNLESASPLLIATRHKKTICVLICHFCRIPVSLFKDLIMQFADIKNDIAFRKIFGNEQKTAPLISFLNASLELQGDHKVVIVTIANPYQMSGEREKLLYKKQWRKEKKKAVKK
jgi:adenylate kinase family enzyme